MASDDRRTFAARHDEDQGFTLIELLVVIIIIGILAAIAIPIYLNQTQKGHEAAAVNDLRNLAGFEELYLTDAGNYGDIPAISVAEPTMKISAGITLQVVHYNGAVGYCIEATEPLLDPGFMRFYDSAAGGVQARGTSSCPVTTTGPSGAPVAG